MKRFLTLFIFVFLFLSPFAFAAEKININTASLGQLDEITGIGPVLAQRVVDARPFSSVDDLLRVKGIGEKTLQKIKDQGLAYVSEKSEIQNPIEPEGSPRRVQSETNPNSQNPNDQNAAEEIVAETPKTYPTGVVINEILPSPEGADDQNEWIELYNTNNSEVDLSSWKIKDKEGSTTNYSLPENTKILAYGYLVLKRPDTKITLNNTTDGLILYWPNGTIIDSMAYEKAPKNQSYNRIGASWQWNTSLTPGAKNIISQNNEKQTSGDLLKIKKSGNSKEIDKNSGTASISDAGANPWFLFLAALAITILSVIVVLFIKIKFKGL